MGNYKDAVLAQLSDLVNIAQFVSFGPDLVQRFSRVHGCTPDYNFPTLEDAVDRILSRSPEGSVNIRSFKPELSTSSDFVYGLREAGAVVSCLKRLANQQFYTIVNETVDMTGGVGGVAMGGVIEFAPGDTPRCVEKPGTACLPTDAAIAFFEKVYGFRPALEFPVSTRVEFTIHPFRRGWRHDHTIIWELEEAYETRFEGAVRWPNLFSRFLGDKAFGLLVADALGLPVPRTTVISRGLPPFTFGRDTGTNEIWLRLCPREQTPGRFTTLRGWADPFGLLEREDPDHTLLASALAQEGVEAVHSGALIVPPNGQPIIEGVSGNGDQFILGRRAPEDLPKNTLRSVEDLFNEVTIRIGDASFEWVYDGRRTWVVQLHCGSTMSTTQVIVPGTPTSFQRFRVTDGIEAFRNWIPDVACAGDGVILVGKVGVTSHMAELLRRAAIPSRIDQADAEP